MQWVSRRGLGAAGGIAGADRLEATDQRELLRAVREVDQQHAVGKSMMRGVAWAAHAATAPVVATTATSSGIPNAA